MHGHLPHVPAEILVTDATGYHLNDDFTRAILWPGHLHNFRVGCLRGPINRTPSGVIVVDTRTFSENMLNCMVGVC